jgi:TolA-binding protein
MLDWKRPEVSLLAVPSISGSKAGQEIRGVLEKANFKRGQDLEVEKKYAESGSQFESFAKQNPRSTSRGDGLV